MAENSVVYVGTVGQSVWRSRDGGETFDDACNGMFIETDVRALAVHPFDSQILYAGTDLGLYRTNNGGDQWERLETPFDPGKGWPGGVAIWSLLIHPQQPDTLFAGVCPAALHRSTDGGRSWQKLNAGLAEECVAIRYARVTCIVADPSDSNTIWVGVEIDGLHCSRDRGETWERRDSGMSSPDIHSFAVLTSHPGGLIASTNNDLNLSMDGGDTWQPQTITNQFPFRYCRGILVKADDPDTLFVGNGNGPPGSKGTLQISHDAGRTWSAAALSPAPNSTIWTFATSPAMPNLIIAASVLGYLYRSEDGGASWQKLPHEFGEIRSLALAHSAPGSLNYE